MRTNERGAVIIQVAVCLLGLLAFSAFVVDYGVMWVSRSQAQNAADAAALGAAQSLAFDNTKDFNKFQLIGQTIGQSNWVWGQPPDIQLTDITFPPCPPTLDWGPDTCVKARVFRNQSRGNPLPTFFASLV